MKIPFLGPAYTDRSINMNCQECINLYPELDTTAAKENNVIALYGTPGFTSFADLAPGPMRNLYRASNDRVFAVGGNILAELSSGATLTNLGSLTTTTGVVGAADNGLQLALVDGPAGYIYDFTSGIFGQITDPDFYGATHVAIIDGYFIFNKPGTSVFYISQLFGTAFDALDFASAEGSPDVIVGLIAANRELWIFGTLSVEVWFNSGNSDFPFERIQGAFLEQGCVAPYSIAVLDNSVFWLGGDARGNGILWRSQGYQALRISNHAMEAEWQSYGDISDVVAFTEQHEGHMFYVMNFPSANRTWVYDVATQMFHRRAYYNASSGFLDRARPQVHAFGHDQHLVGDYENGKIYTSSLDTYSEDGNPLVSERTGMHITNDLKFLFHNSFQVDLQPGVGLDGLGQGVNPQIMLQWSNDGGHTWSSERWVSMGRIGQYLARARWNQLGRARDRVYRVRITDPVKRALIGAQLDAQAGTN